MTSSRLVGWVPCHHIPASRPGRPHAAAAALAAAAPATYRLGGGGIRP